MGKSDPVKTLRLGGRTVEMTGDLDDPYFASVEAIAAGEGPLAAWADANLPSDAVIFDVGGNIGVTALLLAGLRPQGHVHVFEALPRNAAYLQRNMELNDVRNCTVVPAAVGDVPGKVTLDGSGSAAQVVSGIMPEARADGVLAVTLDGYARQQGITRLNFIKVDVEGYEPAVLEGAAGLIEQHRPPVLMEFNSWCLAYAHGFNPFAFAHALWAAFEAYQLGPDGTIVPAGGGDVVTFLHDNMVRHGAVDDLLLRLRAGEQVPKRAASTWAYDEVERARARQLEQELEAMRQSTSWRLTAPLRALKQRFLG